MRDILKVIGVGNLIALERHKSKNNLEYVEGSLLCRDAQQQHEIQFLCFNKELNQRLARENLIGERVKIIGSIRTREDSLYITIYRLIRTTNRYDKADFAAIGILKEVTEQGKALKLTIEAKSFFHGQNFSNILEIITSNKEYFKQKFLRIKEKRVLVKGTIREITGKTDNRTICWLDYIDVLRERIIKNGNKGREQDG